VKRVRHNRELREKIELGENINLVKTRKTTIIDKNFWVNKVKVL